MSLRHGLLDLLAGEPMSGYDLARFFGASMGNVWPAQHSQIYPELAKLAAEGLISQTGEGARGRKVYETTPAGIDELRRWLRESQPDYSFRNEALLRVFCLWVLPIEEALESLARDRVEYVRHLDYIVLLAAAGLLVYGEAMIYFATRHDVGTSPLYYARYQVAYAAVGIVALVGLSLLDYENYRRWQWPLYAFALVSIAAVFALGPVTRGSRRWLTLPRRTQTPSRTR